MALAVSIGGPIATASLSNASARTCSETGTICREHAICCSGQCASADRTGRRRCFQPPTITDMVVFYESENLRGIAVTGTGFLPTTQMSFTVTFANPSEGNNALNRQPAVFTG